MNVKGINFVKFGPDEHVMGIKREQFIDYINSLEADSNGWINFRLTPLIQPIKGFSCKLVHMMPKDVYEAKKAEKNASGR